jgi:lysophospholipase L1-like esterase
VKKRIFYIIYLTITSIILLVLLELLVRWTHPEINYQGTQNTIIERNKNYGTLALKPNTKGIAYGIQIYSDKYGFRRLQTPATKDKTWLFLGDSVTFGVGVEDKYIFPQLIQNHFNDLQIINASIIGYSAQDYQNLATYFLEADKTLEKVVLFYCLNDLYDPMVLSYDISIRERIHGFLRTNSKLYLMLKKVFFDRSKSYALYDISLYKQKSKDFKKNMASIARIKSLAEENDVDFQVVILPYEYQLRINGMRTPQALIKNSFDKNNIQYFDLFDDFANETSESYFLYGDPMHLSVKGHKVVANKMIHVLE